MQNRKDLLQAHRLMTQRAGLALLQGEPDTAEQPLRRMNIATFAGVMIAVLVVAIFWILGILTHTGAHGLPGAGSVAVDENGNSYVRCNQGGATLLCPAVNNASARLAAGAAAGSGTVAVRKDVAGVAGRFPARADDRDRGAAAAACPHRACARSVVGMRADRQQSLHAVHRPAADFHARRGPLGRRADSRPRRCDPRPGAEPGVARLERPALAVTGTVAALLPGGAQGPVQVPFQWVNALARGPDFTPLVPAGFGGPAANSPDGTETIGHVYSVASASGTLWYVQLRDGLAQITQTEFELLQTDLQAQQSPLSLSNVVSHLLQTGRFSPQGLPATLPRVVSYDPATPLCAVYSVAAQVPRGGEVTVGGVIPSGAQPVTGANSAAAQANPPVDQVWLPPGAGALVSVIQGPGRPTAYVLVTGARKYALASPAVAGVLGYAMGTPCTGQCTPVPANIVGLIPAGPALDPNKATQQVTGG